MIELYVLNFGNPMLENTILNVPKNVIDEIGLLTQDSNTAEGAFEKTKSYLDDKITKGEFEVKKYFGGSGPNIISQLASTGVCTTLFAGVGKIISSSQRFDEIGEGILSDLLGYGVRPLLVGKNIPSCEIYTLQHEWDQDRTFAVRLGAAAAMKPDDIFDGLLDNASHFILTQYKIADNSETVKAMVEKAWELQKKRRDIAKIVLDLSSTYHMGLGKQLLDDILGNGVYMLFANAEETLLQLGIDILESQKSCLDAAYKLLDNTEIVVLKLGAKGALIADRTGYYHTEIVEPKPKKINMNGAGDALAAGVLEILIKFGYDLPKANILGVQRASDVIATEGPKMEFAEDAYNKVVSEKTPSLISW